MLCVVLIVAHHRREWRFVHAVRVRLRFVPLPRSELPFVHLQPIEFALHNFELFLLRSRDMALSLCFLDALGLTARSHLLTERRIEYDIQRRQKDRYRLISRRRRGHIFGLCSEDFIARFERLFESFVRNIWKLRFESVHIYLFAIHQIGGHRHGLFAVPTRRHRAQSADIVGRLPSSRIVIEGQTHRRVRHQRAQLIGGTAIRSSAFGVVSVELSLW